MPCVIAGQAFVSPLDIAEKAKLSMNTVHKLISLGGLDHLYFTGRFYVPVETFDAFIKIVQICRATNIDLREKVTEPGKISWPLRD